MYFENKLIELISLKEHHTYFQALLDKLEAIDLNFDLDYFWLLQIHFWSNVVLL